MQPAIDLHQAGVVEGGDDGGFGAKDFRVLFGQHCKGDIGIFDGEGAPKATALVLPGKVNEGEIADGAEEADGTVANVQHTQRVARRMVGDGVREDGTYVLYTKMVYKEFRELEDAWQQRLYIGKELGVVGTGGDEFVVLAHHGDAGGGWHTNDFRVAKDLDKAADERYGFDVVAGVIVHLPAAGLRDRKVNGVAETFKQVCDSNSRLGKESVVVAGDE